jgi:Uma2 family endonuclease
MSTTTLMTVEQFEQLPQNGGARYELKDGELVEMANAKFGHERAKFWIQRCLIAYVLQHPIGEVYSETSFALSPSRVCAPDVAFLSLESAAKGDPDHIYQGAPDLAIEVVSESEGAEDLREKTEQCLAAGAKAVWIVYPKLRIIEVFDQAGPHDVRGEEMLEAPGILPGFRVAAGELFEAATR